MNVDLNNMQRQTINAFNDLVKLLNKSEPNEWGNVSINADKLTSKVRELHNNLAFFGGLIDDISNKCYWEVNPNAEITSLQWDEK